MQTIQGKYWYDALDRTFMYIEREWQTAQTYSRCHIEALPAFALCSILYFASPFFQALLDGNWKETHPSLHSLSDTEDTRGSAYSVEEGDRCSSFGSLEEDLKARKRLTSPRASFYTAHFNLDQADVTSTDSPSSPLVGEQYESLAIDEKNEGSSLQPTFPDLRQNASQILLAEDEVTGRLQRLATPPPRSPHQDGIPEEAKRSTGSKPSNTKSTHLSEANPDPSKKWRKGGLVAIIELSEEKGSTFQDFLSLVYPSE
jgi:hypothetical protein